MNDLLIKKSVYALNSLSVYRKLLNDRVLKKFHNLLRYLGGHNLELENFVNLYGELYYELISSNSTNSFKNFVLNLVLFDENSFSKLAETSSIGDIDPALLFAVSNDLDNLQMISGLSSDVFLDFAKSNICSSEFEKEVITKLPKWEFRDNSDYKCPNSVGKLRNKFDQNTKWSEHIGYLTDFYYKNGTGIFARYNALIWQRSAKNGHLKGIDSPDPVRFQDFIGYEQERLDVIRNTEGFIEGFPANNVLLYGDRGTGKSSTVKALVNEYHNKGLRVIEIPKMYLVDFPSVIREVENSSLKFIIFVDDLSFEDSEESYTTLKAILEGGLVSKPQNVLVYATSNRRHLIKEKFSDRTGFKSSNSDDEVRARDTMQEKLSLSDRFGITVVFSSPDKDKFLRIVEGLVQKRGINIDKDILHREALKWELWYNGRSPRTAKQFVDWLSGRPGSIV